jgi:hypothetical protein
MKTALLSILLLLSQITFAQTYSGPESVEFDYVNNRWLIANTSSHQVLARNSNGVLSVFASGLVNGPYGIEIVGDTLFCCSGSSIKGYLLSNGTPVFNLNLNATFLNGITHDNSGNLITTDFSAKKIYKVNIASQTFSVIASNLSQSPNGIIFDAPNNRCIFVNWGNSAPIKAIDLTSNAVTTITSTTLTNCDGIAVDNQGNYYVSNWSTPATIKKFNNTFTGSPVTVATPSLSSPADIFYNLTGDTLGIPNSGNNTVVFIGFSTAGIDDSNFEKHINVYPNPSNNDINVTINFSSPISIEVTLEDISGRTYETLVSENLTNQQLHFDSSNLSSGFYFLKFKTPKNSFTKSIMINK